MWPSSAQDTNISFEMSYPLAIGNNTFESLYEGLLDMGFKYRFYSKREGELALGLHSGYYHCNNKPEFNSPDFEVYAFTIEPKLYVQWHPKDFAWFRPYAGIGYTWIKFDSAGSLGNQDVSKEFLWDQGISSVAAFAFYINKRLYVHAAYHYFYLTDTQMMGNAYTAHVQSLKFGVGMHF